MSFAVSLRGPSLQFMWLLSKRNYLNSCTSRSALRVAPDETNRAKCCSNAVIPFVLHSLVQWLVLQSRCLRKKSTKVFFSSAKVFHIVKIT